METVCDAHVLHVLKRIIRTVSDITYRIVMDLFLYCLVICTRGFFPPPSSFLNFKNSKV